MGNLPTLTVNELFYSVQGEGPRAGTANVFVRLAGCSAKYACASSGVACDTEFESGRPWTTEALLDAVAAAAPVAAGVIWTGGEPLDQLTPAIVEAFRERGFFQAVETSGARPFPRAFRELFDWVCCSPKVAEHVLVRHFGDPGIVASHPLTGVTPVNAHAHELRYVRHAGQGIPVPALTALHYCLSPHSDGDVLNDLNLRACLTLCLEQPLWRLSVQQHKLWRIR